MSLARSSYFDRLETKGHLVRLRSDVFVCEPVIFRLAPVSSYRRMPSSKNVREHDGCQK
jgi:hypothetical protein